MNDVWMNEGDIVQSYDRIFDRFHHSPDGNEEGECHLFICFLGVLYLAAGKGCELSLIAVFLPGTSKII